MQTMQDRKTAAATDAPSQRFSISDLAKEFALTTRTIRYYEDRGLLAPAREESGSARIYTHRDRARLKLTLRAKRLGFSLEEAKALMDMYDSPRDTVAQLSKYLEALVTHRLQIEAQMRDLQHNLEELTSQEEQARALLAQAKQSA